MSESATSTKSDPTPREPTRLKLTPDEWKIAQSGHRELMRLEAQEAAAAAEARQADPPAE